MAALTEEGGLYIWDKVQAESMKKTLMMKQMLLHH